MDRKTSIITSSLALILANQAFSGGMGDINEPADTRAMVSISGGAAWAQPGANQTFYLDTALLKTYSPTSSASTMAIGEVFLGAQRRVTSQMDAALGLALGMTSNINRDGDIWEQANPNFNNYTYHYAIKQTRLSLKGKLQTTSTFATLTPYITASAGVGFNQAYQYRSTPRIEQESTQPPFDTHTLTSFTYTLGAGIQRSITPNWSLGAGYEFTNIGKTMLGRAAGQTINQGISLSSLYTNGAILSLTYLG